MAQLPGLKETKNQISSSIFLILFLLVVLIVALAHFVNKFVNKHLEVLPSPETPNYLSVPLPDLKNIEEIMQYPKLDELRYQKSIFEPVQPGNRGKPNPFVSM
jgi:hypothetical protein